MGNEGVDNSWDINPVSTPFSMLSHHDEFNKITNTNMCHWKGYGLKSFGGVKKCLGQKRLGWEGTTPFKLYNAVEVWPLPRSMVLPLLV